MHILLQIFALLYRVAAKMEKINKNFECFLMIRLASLRAIKFSNPINNILIKLNKFLYRRTFYI